MKVTFNADKVKISGPRLDGTYAITFETGEYEWENLKNLPILNGDSIYVEVTNEQKDSKGSGKATSTN